MNPVNWLLGWVTGVAPLLIAVVYAIVLDTVDDIIMIIKSARDMKITKKEQGEIDYRRSNRRWKAIKALADKLPFFTVE
jgi:hypothetical protein|tara:strand:- start:43 stop:279 length:237 start_codon:yes stop_codon:yes gene_type:complete